MGTKWKVNCDAYSGEVQPVMPGSVTEFEHSKRPEASDIFSVMCLMCL
jgi:hypothetical protein